MTEQTPHLHWANAGPRQPSARGVWTRDLAMLAAAAFATPFLLTVFCPGVFSLVAGAPIAHVGADDAPIALGVAVSYGLAAISVSFAALLNVANAIEGRENASTRSRHSLGAVLAIGCGATLISAAAN
ncbi:MAG: hypothetical protein AAFX08_09750 [Pseudomonadota bacterium]